MKKDKLLILLDVVLAGLPVVMLALIWDPFGWFGFSDFWMMASTGVFVASIVPFLAFVWREKAEDEREEAHLAIAGRMAFLAGASVLAIAIVLSVFAHKLGPWLPLALATMIVTKIGTLAYLRAKK